MIRHLDRDALLHDDPNHPRHARDKAMAEARRTRQWVEAPSIEREAAVAVLQQRVFDPGSPGWYFRVIDGKAVRQDDAAAYRRWITDEERNRRKYSRVRIREGRERQDTGSLTTGAVSLVATIAPWHVAHVARLPRDKVDALLLRVAEVAAKKIEDVSGRETGGGGIHKDTAIPHLHLHVFQTKSGQRCDKARFLVAGGWNVGAHRLQRKHPDLLSDSKKQMLTRNLEKKDHARRPCIDIAVAEAIDDFMEETILLAGPAAVQAYEADLESYRTRKLRADREARYERLTREGLVFHSQTGIWPIAYHALTREARRAMWRMVPKELRLTIRASIMTYQLFKDPARSVARALTRQASISIADKIKAAIFPAQPQIRGPRMR